MVDPFARMLGKWVGRLVKNTYSGKRRITKNPLLGAALVATADFGRRVLSRSTVQASIQATTARWLHIDHEEYCPIKSVDSCADKVAMIFKKDGLTVNRLAVSGIPGSGKSTLARALSSRLDMQWQSLDHENMNIPLDLTQAKTIYDHHRLLQTQDLELFDAILFRDATIDEAKANILKRTQCGRGGIIVDTLDFEKLQTISKLAFDVCEGEAIGLPDSNVVMKKRPAGGFRAGENLMKRVQGQDLTQVDFSGMKKEEQHFYVAYRKPQYGLSAYFLFGAYNEELLKGLEAGFKTLLDRHD